ncbi:MAG: type II secretion system protein [Candidatus Gottesmanbacteria bacterium]
MTKNNGFLLIEILIAIGLSAIFLPAIGLILSFGLNAASGSDKNSMANQLAQEGMEAIYYLKSNSSDWDWTSPDLDTVTGEYYQPIKDSGDWQLGNITTSPIITPDPFTRKIEIEAGFSGDQYSRKINVYVTWPDKNGEQEVKLESYVTAH